MSFTDETMSQDPAFATDDVQDDTFTFDEAQVVSPDSQSEDTGKEDEGLEGSASPVGTEDHEQKVPYSRFKKQVDEKTAAESRIAFLEGQLAERQSQRASTESPEDTELPADWIELYGDSDVAKRAFHLQQKREAEIQDRAIEQAVERMRSEQTREVETLAQNEATIDENLELLQDSIGKALTAKQEEDLLTIVDEFSPVGADGKYITLFPFDKAYEILTLRQSNRTQGTVRARTTVADLTNSVSEGEADSSNPDFKRGWDNWREAI